EDKPLYDAIAALNPAKRPAQEKEVRLTVLRGQQTVDLPPFAVPSLGFTVRRGKEAVVEHVEPSSEAARVGGLRPDDVILRARVSGEEGEGSFAAVADALGPERWPVGRKEARLVVGRGG